MSRFAWLILLVLPLAALPSSSAEQAQHHEADIPLQLWNKDSLAWSTVLIWTERPSGLTLTSGVLIDKEKRLVLAARHALEDVKTDGSPAGMMKKFYVVWPMASPHGDGVISSSDQYFQQMRKQSLPTAKLIAHDSSRDLALLEAGSPPPAQSRALTLHLDTVEPGTKLLGIAQPFTRGNLWHPFSCTVTSAKTRRLSYSPTGHPVALYLALAEQNVEFGYSGSPLVLPHNGEIVGILLAAQIDQPLSFALISSQEIHRFLKTE